MALCTGTESLGKCLVSTPIVSDSWPRRDLSRLRKSAPGPSMCWSSIQSGIKNQM